MRVSSKGRLAIGIVGVLVIAGVVMWWALQQGKLPTVPEATAPAAPTRKQVSPVAKSPTNETPGGAAVAAKDAPKFAPVLDETDVDPKEPPTWEDHLDGILLSDDNEDGKADKILALLPQAPPDAQEQIAQHLVNMVQDNHYDGTSNLLVNANVNTNVADVLINDLLNRNNTLKLNVLLKVFETPDHPMAGNAREMLELFTQEEHGTNYSEWDSAVAKWLKENEPAPETQAQLTPAGQPQPQ
jgi:hypothetical protein